VRHKRTVFLSFIAAIAVLLSLSANAWAYTTYNGHVLNGGVGNYGSTPRYYYITYTASDHTDDITNAVSTWIHTTSRIGVTTPIYWARTTTQSASVMDWYHNVYYDVGTGIIATTDQLLNNQVISPYNSNWAWCKVKLNTPVYDPLSSYNEEGSCAHEMGHVMGLGHTSVTSRVMCQLQDGRTVNAAQVDDANGINYLY
jgi:Matrixin